jgi:TIR domain-containing protein
MKVFLSWSGERSKAVAAALHELLPSMLQPISCWLSEGGLAKGKPWYDQLARERDSILFAILCVTPENKDSPWVVWEAGFLSAVPALGDRRVAPLAIGMSKGALSGGPLAIYHGIDTTNEDLLRLLNDINGVVPAEKRISPQVLKRTFGFVWPDLERRIIAARDLPRKAPVVPKATADDQLSQVLALLRENQREGAEIKAMIRRSELQSHAGPGRIAAGTETTDAAAAAGSLQAGVGGSLFGAANPSGPSALSRPIRVDSVFGNGADSAARNGLIIASAGAASGKLQKSPVKVYAWNIAHGMFAPPNQKAMREAIGRIPGAMLIEDSVEEIDPDLLDGDGFYRPAL